ncbi:MAG: metallophosphoesterase [Pirellulales bacterium]|nr:metallophosphoesterase [Pirellulales bacterium]
MRLAWLTDIHLNFVDDGGRARFWESVRPLADAVVISGDIAESPTITSHLGEMERSLAMPIYFVLGNHDFYRGSIARTRDAVAEVARRSKHLVYLTEAGVVELTPNTALVGHDGWADARLGDFERSEVVLNDYLLIEELAQRWNLGLDKPALRDALHGLGDEAARHIAAVLDEAFARYRRVVLATHVPPFRETAWHEGRLSNDEWLPHFSSRAAGNAMVAALAARPQSELLVLCGHTHSGGEAEILTNLRVLTGKARYRHPAVERVLQID